jgi:hypothetical protein
MIRDKSIIKLSILILLVTYPCISYSITTEMKQKNKSADVWLKMEKLGEAEDLIVKGENRKALIILEGLLERHENYSEARELYEKVSGLLKTEHDEGVVKTDAKIDLADKYWAEYQEYEEKGNLAMARKKAILIESLFKAGDIKPAFLAEFKKRSENVKSKINFILGSFLSTVKGRIHAAKFAKNSEEKVELLVKAYKSLIEMSLQYPDFESVDILKVELLSELNRASRVLFAKAKTIWSLEGCSAALNEYRSLLKTLSVQELEFYKRTEQEIRRCES